MPDGDKSTISDRSITDSGAQPLVNDEETLFLAVNGEIYNHRILRKQLKSGAKFKTHSDCEVILHLVRSRISGLNFTIKSFTHLVYSIPSMT